jgi:hypothetical protein
MSERQPSPQSKCSVNKASNLHCTGRVVCSCVLAVKMASSMLGRQDSLIYKITNAMIHFIWLIRIVAWLYKFDRNLNQQVM